MASMGTSKEGRSKLQFFVQIAQRISIISGRRQMIKINSPPLLPLRVTDQKRGKGPRTDVKQCATVTVSVSLLKEREHVKSALLHWLCKNVT